MKPPPFLLGAALVFWGWQNEDVLAGALLAVLIESPRVFKARWEFSDDDFSRIWTLCTLLFLGAMVYAFSAKEGAAEMLGFFQNPNFRTQRAAGTASAKALALWLRWWPLVFFPFAAAQVFSTREGIPLTTISLLLRRRWKKARHAGQPLPSVGTFNVSYIYFAMCLFSASVHSGENQSQPTYFWGLCVLLTWALWPHRSVRYALAVWLAVLAAALALGYAGQSGVVHLRTYLERFNPQWLSNLGRGQVDPSRSRTSIGKVGRLKTSGRIVIRVEPKPGSAPPSLLREASYRTYRSQTWYSDSLNHDFENVPAEAETEVKTFVLVPGKTNAAGSATVSCYLPGGQGLLPLPSGTASLDSGAAYLFMGKNGMGTVLAQGPGLLSFDARYGPGPTADTPGGTNDLLVIPRESPALANVIAEFGLAGRDDAETLRKVNGFFQEKFSYSLWQERSEVASTNETPVSHFLLRTRSGHCEYFATATVLLLRKLGIPARYAVGYAVHEAAGQKYVVRLRDAHAWCLAWNKEKQVWQDFDTTPASWVEAEEKHASIFQFLQDAWSRLFFEFSKIRWGQTRLRDYLLWALAPILVILAVQIILRSRRLRQRHKGETPDAKIAWPGLDSEFYQIAGLLAARGVPRPPGESLATWLPRAVADPALADTRVPLQSLLLLHYRYRFDPQGLGQADREQLRRDSKACFNLLSRSSVRLR